MDSPLRSPRSEPTSQVRSSFVTPHELSSDAQPVPTASRTSATSPLAAIENFLGHLRSAVGDQAVERHLVSDAHLVAEKSTLRIVVESTFHKAVLERRFASAMHEALKDSGFDTLVIEVDGSVRTSESTAHPLGGSSRAPAHAPARASTRRRANRTTGSCAHAKQRYELGSFVVGPSNRMAYSTIMRVATNEHGHEFSPLFIHGTPGLGKTHLLQGAAQEYQRRHPGAKVRYTTAEAFTNSYITAVRSNTLDAFRRTWRGVDLLCVDDVHFFSGKEKTQSELMHTFDAIDLSNARVVLASDAHPRQIRELSSGLVSRLLSGAVVRIDPPDERLRHELIRRLAAKRQAVLSEDAVVLLASRAGASGEGNPTGEPSSVRDLEGLVTQVIAVAELLPGFLGQRQEIGLLAVRRALGLGEWTPVRSGSAKPVRIETIIEHTCACLRVEPSDVFGRTRHRRVVLARTLISYLSREMTTRSYPEIARAMRRPTHSTIVAARQRFVVKIRDHEIVTVGSPVDGLTMGQLADRVRAEIESVRG